MITVTCEDNMALMSRYPDKHFDLAIVDPEYGQNASKPTIKNHRVLQNNGTYVNIKNNRYSQKKWDEKPAGKEFFDELIRVSKHQIIWGVNNYDYIFGKGRIVWNKINGESDQYGCEIAYCSLNDRTDIVHYMWSGMFQGIYCGFDIRKALVQQGNKKLNEPRMHPTQKPVILSKWLLDKYAKHDLLGIKPLDQVIKILDTNYGYGGMGIACHELGFDLTACDNDEEYINLAVDRLKKYQDQLTITF